MAARVRPQKLFCAKSTLAWFLGTPFTSYPQRLRPPFCPQHAACGWGRQQRSFSYTCLALAGQMHNSDMCAQARTMRLHNADTCVRQYESRHYTILMRLCAQICILSYRGTGKTVQQRRSHRASLMAVSPPSTPVFIGSTCSQLETDFSRR